MTGNQLLTTGEIAQALGVHRTTVHHWARLGRIKPTTVANGVRLFAPEVLEQLLAERSVN